MKSILDLKFGKSFILLLLLLFVEPAFAAKDSSNLSFKTRDGSDIVYGSVLKAKENEIKTKLSPKAFKAVREAGVENLSVSITKLASENETSSVCVISTENLDLFGKVLLINVLPCTNTGGATVTAGALDDGKYRLSIIAGSQTFQGSFQYKRPVVAVGNVSSTNGNCMGGTNQINSLTGSAISPTVALSNCSYFNEVQAERVAQTVGGKGKKPKKKGNKRVSLSQQLEDNSSSSGSNEEGVAAGDVNGDGFYQDETGFSSDTAISEAVITTDEGLIEEKKAAINLDPEKNGDVQFDIDDNSTAVVDNALDFLGKQGEDLSEEDLKIIEDTLKDEVDVTLLCDETSPDCKSIIEGVDNEPLDFQKCNVQLDLDLANSVSENPTQEELVALGQKIINLLQDDTNNFKFCFPPFVLEKIVPFIQEKGNDGFVKFAQGFLDNVKNSGGRPDPKNICAKLKDGLGFLKECKGQGCPPAPCFPDEIRTILKSSCPELLALLPENKCEVGPVACNLKEPPKFGPGPNFDPVVEFCKKNPADPKCVFLGNINKVRSSESKAQFTPPQGPSGGEGFTGFPPGSGPQECFDIGKQEQPSICKPCETNNDCFGPEARDITTKEGVSCRLPAVICKSLEVGSAVKKVCLFEDTPKDPLSCKPLPLPPEAVICSDLRPPLACGISESGIEGGFDIQCCLNSPFGGPGGGFGPPKGFGGSGNNPFQTVEQVCGNGQTEGIEQCDDGNTLSGDGCTASCTKETTLGFCATGCDDSDQCTIDVCDENTKSCVHKPDPQCTSGQPGGGEFLDCFKNPDDPRCQKIGGGRPKFPFNLCVLQKLCSNPQNNFDGLEFGKPKQDIIQIIIEKCKSESVNPPGSGNGQLPCDPTKDPNCKPPGGFTGGQPPCDPTKDPNCKPPGGFTGGQPPCDPTKDPNCKPPEGFTGGQPPV